MKKMKEYLNLLVDKKTLSYVIPYYFSITLSVVYLIVSYIIIIINFGYEIKNSQNIFQAIFINFSSLFIFTLMSI